GESGTGSRHEPWVAPRPARLVMSRFRSLRWRLTFLYLGLLAVLLLAGGVAQYFAAREVLFRTNADVLASEYNAVFTAFRKANASRPAAALRPLILSQQFTNELRSRNTSAAVFDLNGGQVALTPASLGTEQVPTLTTQASIDAARRKPQAYYLATASPGAQHYHAARSGLKHGTQPLPILHPA